MASNVLAIFVLFMASDVLATQEFSDKPEAWARASWRILLTGTRSPRSKNRGVAAAAVVAEDALEGDPEGDE